MHGEQEQIATFQTWNVAPQHSSFCHVRVIVRIVQWVENSGMKLAYLHIFVRRGRRSNTDIWFQVQEAENVAVYGDKRTVVHIMPV